MTDIGTRAATVRHIAAAAPGDGVEIATTPSHLRLCASGVNFWHPSPCASRQRGYARHRPARCQRSSRGAPRSPHPLLDRDDLTPTTRQSMAPCRSSRIPRRTILMPASGVSPQPADGPRRHPHPVTWPPRCTASTALTGCGTDAAASPRVTARNSRPTNGHIRTTAYRLVNDQKEPPCRI